METMIQWGRTYPLLNALETGLCGGENVGRAEFIFFFLVAAYEHPLFPKNVSWEIFFRNKQEYFSEISNNNGVDEAKPYPF
jgi:hypothetical protein